MLVHTLIISIDVIINTLILFTEKISLRIILDVVYHNFVSGYLFVAVDKFCSRDALIFCVFEKD